jgi:hypothetical protein
LRGIQEQLSVDRQRRSYAQPLPGAVVDFIGNRIQLLLAVPSQVGAPLVDADPRICIDPVNFYSSDILKGVIREHDDGR